VDSLKLEGFSSQGPTDDQRNKPELVAPDGVRSAAFELVDGHAVFQGTSAAAPHAAGFAALLKQLNPASRGEQLKADVIKATSLMDSLPNNSTGSGMIDARKVTGNAGNNESPGAKEALKPLINILR
jgi:subtilisin family serine protease